MNCIILLLLLFCGGNSCSNGCSCIGNSNRSSCGNNNSCGNSNNSCGAVVPVAARMPAAHVVWKTRDAVETETADRPDRISRISHRWMIRHFPGEMTEDARPVDVSRIPENMGNRKAPELSWQFRGLFCLKD